MASRKKMRFVALGLLSAVALPCALMAACSGNDNNSNPVPVVPTYGIEAGAPDATVGGGDDSSTGGGEDSSADAKEEGRVLVPEDAQACTLARLPAPGSVATDAGCWNCAPQTNVEFLNQCAPAGVTCAPFDNNARLPGYDGGPLPSYN
jgi:hypothetical protein